MNSERGKKYEDVIQMLAHSHKAFVGKGGEEERRSAEERREEILIREQEWRQEEREKTARFLKRLLVCQSIIILLLVVAQAFSWGEFELSDWIFYILVGGFFAETCVLFQIMCIYLFPKGDRGD